MVIDIERGARAILGETGRGRDMGEGEEKRE